MTDSSTNAGLSVLQVRRVKRAPDALEYRYLLPDGRSEKLDRTQHSRDGLELDLQEAATRLHQWSQSGEPDPAAHEMTLKQLGERLSERYLSEDVLVFLFASDGPLAIETNDPTFPWALVSYHGDLLGTFRPLGLLIPAGNGPKTRLKTWGPTRHALLVGNATCDDPSASAQEIKWLKQALEAYRSPYEVNAKVGEVAELNVIENLLHDPVELFHFAGHVGFDPEHPDAMNLLFRGGGKLTPADLRGIASAYSVVFVNGCASARAIQESLPGMYNISTAGQRVTGLATPFLENGASAFIGALWPVEDNSAFAFAQTFYELALQGVSFGEALRETREEWRAERPTDPTWGAYVLYGDPRQTLDTARDPEHAQLDDPRRKRTAPRAHVPSGSISANARMRGDLAATFFEQYSDASEMRLAPSGAAAIERTIAWVTSARWHIVARFDLLLGLAHDPDGVVARGLRAYGCDEAEIERMNLRLFEKGRGALDLPYASSGVATAFRRAARRAEEDGRDEVTADDLAVGLLDFPNASGSLLTALNALGCSPRDLLAAGRGEQGAPNGGLAGPIHSEAFTLHEQPGREDPKADKTPLRLLRDLRAEVKSLSSRGDLPPFIGRDEELRAMVRILTRDFSPQSMPTVTPHVVVRGPAGAGGSALAYELMARITLSPDAGELAPVRDWGIFALRVSRDSDHINDWLRDEVAKRRERTILLIEDLPELLSFPGLSETLMIAARHVNIRLVVVARTQEYTVVRNEYPGLARLFNTIEAMPARPEEAMEMVRAHLPRLQKDGAQITSEAVTAAVQLTAHSQIRSLPGAPLTALRNACAEVMRLAMRDEDADAALRADASEPQGVVVAAPDAAADSAALQQPTMPETAPQVTAEVVRAVVARLHLA